VHANAKKVAEALEEHGHPVTVRELDSSARTAAEAAASLGCPVGAIGEEPRFYRR
jgi:prolyl-tRNA editing enzyme YbaK/EbsC (Cys-tRNA(Pro) deacylase)